MTNPVDELLEYYYAPPPRRTVCQRRPELCQPRRINHVSFDADDTMWRIEPYGIASNITGELRKIDEDTVEEIPGPPKPVERKPPPPPERPPVMQVWDKKRGRWEWFHKTPRKEELEEWWTEKMTPPQRPPEKEREVQEIAQELTQSLTEEEREVLAKWYGVEPQQLELIPTKPPPKALPPPPPERPKYEPKRVTIKLLPTFRDTLSKLEEKGITKSVISLNSPGSVKRIVDAFGLSHHFIEVKDSWDKKSKVFDKITEAHHINPCNALFLDNMLGHVEEVSDRGALGLVIGKGQDVEKPIEIMNYIVNGHGS